MKRRFFVRAADVPSYHPANHTGTTNKRLIGADNTVSVALYTLEKQKNGRWRIAGCRIAPSTVQAA